MNQALFDSIYNDDSKYKTKKTTLIDVNFNKLKNKQENKTIVPLTTIN